MSLERLKKKISSFAAGRWRKKTYPAGAPEINPYTPAKGGEVGDQFYKQEKTKIFMRMYDF